MLIIDNREHALIELFKNETESQTENCDIVVEALDVGDVLIRLGRDYIYERKTLADLAAKRLAERRTVATEGRPREEWRLGAPQLELFPLTPSGRTS